MKRKINIWLSLDWITIGIYFVLVFLGWINIYAAVYNEDFNSIFDFTQKYGKQLIWIIASIVLVVIILIIESKFYSFFAYFIYGSILLLLIFVLIFGREVHGAKSWIEIGGFRLQPSEFAKFATNLALAKYISSHSFKIKKLKYLFVSAAIIFLPAVLILLQNDTGSALVYVALIIVLYREGLSENILLVLFLVGILFILSLIYNVLYIEIGLLISASIIFWFSQRSYKKLFVGLAVLIIFALMYYLMGYFNIVSIPLQYIPIISILSASIIYFFIAYRDKIQFLYFYIPIIIGSLMFTLSVDYFFNNILEPHQQKRINTLLGIESDPLGVGYNVNQSKIAIGSGGLFGKGFLQGTQTKFDFVPEQSTDFIFCTVGEEWGFVGTTIVVILFVLLLIRLVMLAERQRSDFSRAFGYGVVAILFFHVVINIGMTIGIAPVIGIPLPFFSYGGSSLWGFSILLFIFLRLDSSRLEILR